ncbi:MAG: NAD(P)H-dependent oxidoreductase [Treponema sp.]|nr:NAD(P)H-dependent oxidoreductase [Treponema sp.]
MKLLFVNGCVRENSRTLELARHLLTLLTADLANVNDVAESSQLMVEELELAQLPLCGHSRKSLEERDKLLQSRDFHHEMFDYAHQFASADLIVVAAPYWDLSFPAIVKTYIENICVSGITFDYEGAVPVGMCRAKKFYYVTTAGGPMFCDYGYSYWESLCKNFFGIKETCCIKVEGLDMIAPDQVVQKLQQVKDEMKSLL